MHYKYNWQLLFHLVMQDRENKREYWGDGG